MSYPAITSRRMPYDIDGTVVGSNGAGGNSFATGITTWFTSGDLIEYNDEDLTNVRTMYYYGEGWAWWMFFPEKREIEAMCMLFQAESVTIVLEGSNDTTNGMDGTWNAATFPNGNPNISCGGDVDAWRTNIKAVSFSTSYKAIRFRGSFGAHGNGYLFGFHFYGRKAAGETPDDILVLDNELETPAEFTALKDWGDRPEGTTVINSIRLKNDSATKVANNINIQLNNADYLISWDQVSWSATLDIASLSVGSVSSPIYIKQSLDPPLLILGARAARLNITVGSWAA